MKVRGNKTSKTTRELRTRKSIEYLQAGNTVTQTAKALGISRDTLWRNLRLHYKEFASNNQEAIAAMVRPLMQRAMAGHWPSMLRVLNLLEGKRTTEQFEEEADEETTD